MSSKESPTPIARRHERCGFIKCCYLADALSCYGFKADCVLYLRSNGQDCSSQDFDREMNSLIDQARAKAQSLVD